MSTLQPSSFILEHQHGILSTHSQSFPGFPFGSSVPYIISPTGRISIYLSELAEHTKNIRANNKVALTISDTDAGDSPSTIPRITCLGFAVESEDQIALKSIYQQKFTDAKMILSLPGFSFFELELEVVRLIAGFGQIEWLSPEQISF